MRGLSIILILCLLLLSACKDDPAAPDEGFAVTVRVEDPAGDPVSGLELMVWNFSTYLQDDPTKAKTSIVWTQPVAARARLVIEDVEGALVRVLSDESGPAGLRTVAWNGADAEGTHQHSGRYTVRLQGFDPESGALAYEETCDMWMVMISFRDDVIYPVTNGAGRVILQDQRLFPHLYDLPDLTAYDEIGDATGTIELTSDMRAGLRDPASGDTQFYRVVIARDGETVDLEWDPEPPVPPTPRSVATPDPVDKPVPPPYGWDLRPPFPNPFN